MSPETRTRISASLMEILRRQPAAEQLIGQVRGADIHGDLTMPEIHRPRDRGERSAIPDGPLPTIPTVLERGTPVGEILVWMRDGYVDSLEYAWHTDQAPTQWPAVDDLVFPT